MNALSARNVFSRHFIGTTVSGRCPCDIYSRYSNGTRTLIYALEIFPHDWLNQTVIMTEAATQPSRKIMLESTSSTSSTEDKERSNLYQIANMREILHGISNYQHILANFMIRLDTQGNHMEELTKEIRGRNGIQGRLEEVS